MNEARINEIYEIISGMKIRLERDPAAVLPGYIQQHLAQCHDFSSELTNLIVEVGRSRSKVEQAIELLKQTVDIKYSEALIRDPEIQRRRSATDRAAMARLKVAEDSNALAAMREREVELRYVSEALKRKERELKIVNSDIRLQSKVMEMEVGLAGGTGRIPDDPEPEEVPDEPINDALSRGDGTPVIAVEDVDVTQLDPTEGAPPVPVADVDVQSLVSGMSYDIPEVKEEERAKTVDELLAGLG